MNKLSQRIPFHPFLWAAYPVLALLGANLGQVYLWMGVRSLIVSLIGSLFLLVILRLLFGDWHEAALPTSLLLVMLYTYGHIYPSIEDATILNINIGRHRFLLLFMLLLLAALIIWTLRQKRGSLGSVTQIINIITLILVVLPLLRILSYQVTRAVSHQARVESTRDSLGDNSFASLSLPTDKPAPDIYLIILDAYGRQDTLWDYFSYDNQAFINQLEETGFFVAVCSQSNYSVTEFSIASMLNMEYLEQPGGSRSQSDIEELINRSTVRQAFEKLGYQSIAFESGYGLTEVKNADIYYSSNLRPGLSNYLGGINAFEALLLRTSIGFLLFERFDTLPDNIKTMLSTAYAEHRNRILYTFESLEQVPQTDSLKFVFAHILAPHNPFVFGADGQLVVRSTPFTLNHDPESSDPQLYALGYTDQLTYINTRTADLIKTLLEKSTNPPIIILLGDHGPMLRATSAAARMTNLIAIYAPPGSVLENMVYDEITPINIFRLVLDSLFHTQLGLVEDISYFGSRSTEAEQFTIIPNDCDRTQPSSE